MQSYQGYFKVWRKLMLNPIWQKSKPEHKVILITILASAQWDENTWEWNGQSYTCKAGEFISSYGNIAKDCGKGITAQMVRDAFTRFKKLDFLTWDAGKSRTDGIKVKILNWNNYQAEEKPNGYETHKTKRNSSYDNEIATEDNYNPFA